MPTALITGISGQDGSYLTEFLLGHGYRVIGITRDARRALEGPHARAIAGADLVEGSVTSAPRLLHELIQRERPDEVYHLGGPSRVGASWDAPDATRADIVLQTAMLVDAVLEHLPSPRVFLAGSCEIFAAEDHAQDESAPRAPVSPYGRAKLEAMQFIERARTEYGVYAVSGILFNHESPRRGEGFVSRKIARAAAACAAGRREPMSLGNVDARRDWGFAGDYVRAMWLMMFQDEPEDLVIGTGVAHSVADFCEAAFRHVGLDWREHVAIDPSLFRPGDAPLRMADPSRAKARLGWTPEVDFLRLVGMMVDAELGVER